MMISLQNSYCTNFIRYRCQLSLFQLPTISNKTPTAPTADYIAIRRYKFPQMPLSLIFLLFPLVHYFRLRFSFFLYTYDILCSLTYDQYSICGKTRGVGVSNVFLTYFDYFFGGQYKLGGLRGTRWGLNPPTPRQIEQCL